MAQSDKMKEVLEKLEHGVQEFFTSDRYVQYLNVMSRFHDYSLNNQILIASQMPEATRVAGFSSWIRNFERHVKKGEKAIMILAPSKRMIEVETDKADEFGNAIIEKREILTFRPVPVFDVSQTDGKELPELVSELSGKVDNFETLFTAIKAVAPYHIDIRAVESEAKGWCDYTSEVIVIKEGMSEAQTLKTAIHETAHGRIHGGDREKSRQQKEVEAESIAYVVCSHFGLDTSDYSFGYVAAWAGSQDAELLKQSMQTIRDESKAVISAIEQEIMEPGRTIRGRKQADIEADVAKQMEAMPELSDVQVRVVDAVEAEENQKVTVMAAYTADITEYDVKQKLDAHVNMDGISLSVVPVNRVEAKVPEPDREKMTDTSWPMVTVLSSSMPDKVMPGQYMNILEAQTQFRQMDHVCRLAGEKMHVKVAVAYTYRGMAHKVNDIVMIGDGRRNCLDYLDVSPDVCIYLKRHVQILDVVDKCRNENAVGKTGTRRQERYEDMIYDWAEEMRLKLNYMDNPAIRKPPEYDAKLVQQYKDWEVAR